MKWLITSLSDADCTTSHDLSSSENLAKHKKVRHLIWNDSRVATEYNILTVGKST